MKRAILCVLVLGVAAAAYALSFRSKPTLEANPELEPGMEFRTFATLWLDVPKRGQLICLVSDDGTCYRIPQAWKAPLEQVTDGQTVALPPTWHLWPKIDDDEITESASHWLKGSVILRGKGKGRTYFPTSFYSPAPKRAESSTAENLTL